MRLLIACLVYAGYWVRPYDMLADRRRWFWQRRTYCGGVIEIPGFELPDRRTP